MPRNAAGLGDSFSYRDGLAAGLTPDELRHPGWSAPFRGVRSFTEPSNVPELAHGYAAKAAPHQFFSHTTAALLHGMWLPLRVEQRMEVHVGVPPGHRQPRGAGVIGHLLIPRPGLVVEVDGLRVARPEEAWCQLATVLGLDDLVIAGESLMAKNRARRLPLRALVHAVQAGDRPRQTLLNRALPALREGVRSPRETELRRFLVSAGLPEPEINQDIYDDLGRRVAEGDLVYRAHKVVVQYEGELHFLDDRTQRKDVHQYERLQMLGWRVVRVTKDDLRDRRDEVVARVRAALAAAAR